MIQKVILFIIKKEKGQAMSQKGQAMSQKGQAMSQKGQRGYLSQKELKNTIKD
jgi:hypothetical protein